MSETLRKPPAGNKPRRATMSSMPSTDAARLAPGLHIVATPIGNLATSPCARSRRWRAPT